MNSKRSTSLLKALMILAFLLPVMMPVMVKAAPSDSSTPSARENLYFYIALSVALGLSFDRYTERERNDLLLGDLDERDEREISRECSIHDPQDALRGAKLDKLNFGFGGGGTVELGAVYFNFFRTGAIAEISNYIASGEEERGDCEFSEEGSTLRIGVGGFVGITTPNNLAYIDYGILNYRYKRKTELSLNESDGDEIYYSQKVNFKDSKAIYHMIRLGLDFGEFDSLALGTSWAIIFGEGKRNHTILEGRIYMKHTF